MVTLPSNERREAKRFRTRSCSATVRVSLNAFTSKRSVVCGPLSSAYQPTNGKTRVTRSLLLLSSPDTYPLVMGNLRDPTHGRIPRVSVCKQSIHLTTQQESAQTDDAPLARPSRCAPTQWKSPVPAALSRCPPSSNVQYKRGSRDTSDQCDQITSDTDRFV